MVKKEKIEVIIDNRKGDLRNKNNNNETDELEAYGYITVDGFRNWLMKSYIDLDHLNNVIKKDLEVLNEKTVILFIYIS